MGIMAQAVRFVGIDVSKAMLDVHCLPDRSVWQVSNDASGIAELVSRLRPDGASASILLEASGGYEAAVLSALSAAGLVVRRIDPRRVLEYKRSRGQRAKTDRIDARSLAEMARSLEQDDEPPPVHREDPARNELRWLVDRRRQLVELVVTLTLQAQTTRASAVTAVLRDQAKALQRCLREQIRRLDALMAQLLKRVPSFAEAARILRSVPSIGPVSVATLLAHLPDLGRLHRRAIAALVGVAPFVQKSRKWSGIPRIQGGREPVRSLLFVVVMGGKNAVLAEYCRRLRAEGKLPKVAIIAGVNKLLTILNAMMRSGQIWQGQAHATAA